MKCGWTIGTGRKLAVLLERRGDRDAPVALAMINGQIAFLRRRE